MPHLPHPVATYFGLAPDANLVALASVFAAEAVVHDEARDHRGIQAIRDWRVDTMARTPSTARPLSVEARGNTVIVPAEVTGEFPGSPLTLNHRFTLRDGRVAELEIGA
ncbi:nuclear transport factor 2 family protein [Roseomonas sp. 18066]|uniref:nuclear transport factor 2 family protein n=1 Tax=Roseomonas sp. 18066 TaxID=2681412 RepID=UPI0013571A06|nr:nuclear transport factor 2 family protein [Roseomonas sp. 18066]